MSFTKAGFLERPQNFAPVLHQAIYLSWKTSLIMCAFQRTGKLKIVNIFNRLQDDCCKRFFSKKFWLITFSLLALEAFKNIPNTTARDFLNCLKKVLCIDKNLGRKLAQFLPRSYVWMW